MNYDFIRKLAVKVSEQEAGAIIKLLLSHNIEAYAEGTEENKKEGRIYIAAGKETRLSNGNLYVAAADRARAVELLEANGYGEFICRDEQEAAVLSSVMLMPSVSAGKIWMKMSPDSNVPACACFTVMKKMVFR